MSSQTNLIIFCLVISAVLILAVFKKSRHFRKSLFLSALSGTGALFAVNVLSRITGISIGINYITLLISALGGIPSVIGLLMSRFILFSL